MHFFPLIDLKSHLELKHNPGRRKHKCAFCAAAFVEKNAMKNHIQTKHPGCRWLGYACEAEGCEFTTENLKIFQKHKKDKHYVNPFGCDKCDWLPNKAKHKGPEQ